MGQIDLSKIGSLSIDLSQFPNAAVEIYGKTDALMRRLECSSHTKATELFNNLNNAWYQELKRREDGQ